LIPLPEESMLGGLVTYIEQSLPEVKQPMGVNWDLSRRLKERKVRGNKNVLTVQG